ncbi:MAG: sat [Dehalococcoidia bacterium]|nr:sat [Dehalococcoidia bacterium]
MTDNIAPHGGTLINRLALPDKVAALDEQAKALPRLRLTPREVSDLELIAIGGFSPLEGFMVKRDYLGVLKEMHLSSGLPWSLPVTLSAEPAELDGVKEGKDIALEDEEGRILALLHLEEIYPYDKEEEARLAYRTTEDAHPGVAAVYAQGSVLLGGRVTVLRRPDHKNFLPHRLDPADTRRVFAEKGWRRVVGFQTRNPVHRAHEYIQKCALETVDGLLLHPIVGETKGDDIPADVRMRCYEALLAGYYPGDRVVLSVNPAAMRYAGPREAIFHALVRKNFGCTHFIVGRDHAGVGNYYGTYDAQRIFDEFAPGELGITPMFFDNTFYCRSCGGMASLKTCPHNQEHHVALSGTQVRTMLTNGEIPPEEFTRPEVAKVLIASYRGDKVEAAR